MMPCEAGCKVFDGGERRHHKDCVFYPESLSKTYDDMGAEIVRLRALLFNALPHVESEGDDTLATIIRQKLSQHKEG